MDESVINAGERHLSAHDPVLAGLIASQTLTPRPRRTDYFVSLCRSIIGQQVSVAAAEAIAGRFENRTSMQPHHISTLSEDEAKLIGLSRQKAGYLRDLAGHFVRNPAVYVHLDSLSDEEVIRDLTAVKGIGVWTAQMFMMFTLGRPDVFAPDDVGLQNAILKLYDLSVLPPKRELAIFAEAWAPYRSVASVHLWQSLNNVPD